ncbi:hypothetical protein [Hymenobacter sp. GOD-10R]|uniref:hypothetical protein n=1 Tax=Hymenobacter sp. GOD-10R TaxID=3093922 RepID=UPI002D76CD37|nr:hypothetical protein [Hymenobacter sp. GOD-10R]WRQ26686.1 hypothetical protein SD425_16560 [Hymenobacter sp. GOD-10R]
MPQTFTLTYSDGRPNTELTVPTSWRDVTTAQYLRLMAGTDTTTPVLCVLTDLTEADLGKLAATDAVYLNNCLAFAEDQTELHALTATPGLPDVGAASYGKLLLSQQYIESIQDDAHGFAAAAYMLALYSLPDDVKEEVLEAEHQGVLGLSITETYANLNFIWGRFLSFTQGTKATPATALNPTTTKRKPGSRRSGIASVLS